MIPRDEGEEAEVLGQSAQSLIAFLRWFSALVVVAAHLRAVLFVGYSDLPPDLQSSAVAAVYALTAFSHEAVIAFFVLSGCLVGGLNLRKVAVGRFSQSSYAIDRFTRIYVTLLPALLLTVALDWAGRSALGWTGFYDNGNALIAERFADAFKWDAPLSTLLANVAMLQPVYAPVLGSNVPLWSLSYEIWFYLWFAVVAGALVRRSTSDFLVIAVATLVLAAFFGGVAVYYLLIWCLGALALTWKGWPSALWLPIGVIALSLAFASTDSADFWLSGQSAKYSDLPLGIGVAWLVAVVRHREHPVLRRTFRFNHWGADFSYSLYLIHFPTMLVVTAPLSQVLGLSGALRFGLLPTATPVLLYGLTLLAVVVLAFGFSRLCERRTGAIRRALRTSLLGPHAPTKGVPS